MPLLLTLAALLALPLAEIAAFIAVGSAIGVGWTLLLVVAATVCGLVLMRRQGFATLAAARAEARAGRVPEREIVQGAMLVFAGILLVLPGFITDALALPLLLPPVREALWRSMRSRVVVRASAPTRGRPFAGGSRPAARPAVVDLEAEDFARREPGRPDSPWRDPDGRAG